VQASQAPAALLGHWRELGSSGEILSEHMYHDDGTVHIINNVGGISRGLWRYSVDGSTITHSFAPPGQPVIQTTESSSYYVADDVLMLGAFLPEGPVDGLVGTWRKERDFGGSVGPTDVYRDTLVIHADGTASYSQTIHLSTSSEDTFDFEGQWSMEGSRLIIQDTGPEGLHHFIAELRFAPSAIIGDSLSQRVQP
jgi:hypothetical protein